MISWLKPYFLGQCIAFISLPEVIHYDLASQVYSFMFIKSDGMWISLSSLICLKRHRYKNVCSCFLKGET